MNGYLVQASCDGEKVPLALFADERDAERYAAGVTQTDVSEVAYRVLESDVDRVHGIDVVLFVDGLPAASRRLVEWRGGQPA